MQKKGMLYPLIIQNIQGYEEVGLLGLRLLESNLQAMCIKQIFYIKQHNLIREESGIGKMMPDLLYCRMWSKIVALKLRMFLGGLSV